ncbi:MAG: hypothetical protein OXF75_14100 [Acidimicrobiaceae bacterium]|nr:hypothetical protein [Acidimicrobiaceae bacterium]
MPPTDDPFGTGAGDDSSNDPFVPVQPWGVEQAAPSESEDLFAAEIGDTGSRDPFGALPGDATGTRGFAALVPSRSRLWIVAVIAVVLAGGAVSVTTRDQQKPTARSEQQPPPTTTPASTPSPTSLPPTTTPATSVPETTLSQAPTTTVADDNSPDDSTTVAEPEVLLGCDAPTGSDPHRLLSLAPDLERLAFCGEETWQVFACSAREADLIDRVAYVDDVLEEVAAWFDWASAGQYDVDFSAGDDTRWVPSAVADSRKCFEEALQTEWSTSRRGAFVLVDEDTVDSSRGYAGIGTCGYIGSADAEFARSGRMAAVAVHSEGNQTALAVHELGHAQCWPHTYSGRSPDVYDDPSDVMSFAWNWPIGTLAVNRYASGWIHPDQVRVHRQSSHTYTLSPCCSGGVQMLALLPANAPDGFNSQWWHLEVRDPANDWERGLADADVGEVVGIVVHWIEQVEDFGNVRRQVQVGAQLEHWKGIGIYAPHMSTAGTELCLRSDQPTALIDCNSSHEWRVVVSASQSGGLDLTVIEGD